MEYQIEITETLSRVVTMVANSKQEALRKTWLKYQQQEIILDNADFVDYKIQAMQPQSQQD